VSKKKLVAVAALLVVAAGIIMVMRIGPRNVLGMLQYDQREEGALKVGDVAPDVELLTLNGSQRTRLSTHFGDRPLVMVFGSFT
jgi:hypothetical protein